MVIYSYNYGHKLNCIKSRIFAKNYCETQDGWTLPSDCISDYTLSRRESGLAVKTELHGMCSSPIALRGIVVVPIISGGIYPTLVILHQARKQISWYFPF